MARQRKACDRLMEAVSCIAQKPQSSQTLGPDSLKHTYHYPRGLALQAIHQRPRIRGTSRNAVTL